MKALEKLAEKWEKEYTKAKEGEVQELYNDLSTVIIEKGAYRAHVIEALSLLLMETLQGKLNQIQAERKLSVKTPSPITK